MTISNVISNPKLWLCFRDRILFLITFFKSYYEIDIFRIFLWEGLSIKREENNNNNLFCSFFFFS